MKGLVHVRTVSILSVAALLMLAPAVPGQAQKNSLVVPSSSGATDSAPSMGDAVKPAKTGKSAARAGHPKKKKTSFAHKMRDKAMEKFQKLFGSKEPKQDPEPE